MLNGEDIENSKKTTIGPISKIAVVLHDYNVKLPSFTFYGGNVPCVPVRFFFFFTAAHFHLGGRWHFSLPLYKNFHVFFQRNSSPLFFISRSSSFSVIHISVHIKILSRKTDSALVFLGGHAIYRQYARMLEMLEMLEIFWGDTSQVQALTTSAWLKIWGKGYHNCIM